jgi:hypothetical protein
MEISRIFNNKKNRGSIYNRIGKKGDIAQKIGEETKQKQNNNI